MQRVKAWEEKVIIPTYQIGKPDRNPMFLEKRVYQGSSGSVYPHPVIDKVFDEKENKPYIALFLENEFLKIMILPEIGGRIQMAYDKTNHYHFIYYNQVIKPALVGLAGPWISGGIEFNWPQHHRPSTFDPVDYTIEENADGSQTVWVNEIERMFHTKGAAGFTLYPGKAYLEVTGKLYNRTPFPQSFLWWANPAVHVDEHYQSVFPPDVHAVYDHGRRDVSDFPIATGTFYKVDYSPGTDISRYQNIPVPTSYMAVNSNYDFVGGYHHQKKAGMLHISDHHISPGKKQWTWGSGDFGKMWDRQLTDHDGPYFEIMTGVYTDNQPDFSWIMPNEERIFKQYFLPYKEIGYVKNANKEAAVNLEINNNRIIVKVYVTSVQKSLRILLKYDQHVLLNETADLSPENFFSKEITIPDKINEEKLCLELINKDKQAFISYHPPKQGEKVIPSPAKAIGDPKEIKNSEELYLAGLHLEQYRHATFSPVSYYEEALQRDPTDIRCNNALGRWYLKHGQFSKAAPFFKNAIEKLTRHNLNPYEGEPYYNQGLCLTYMGKWDEAYDSFYKSAWNAAWQDNAYLQLAYIDCRQGDLEKALENIAHSLARNYHGMKARHLKGIILRKLKEEERAEKWLEETLNIDTFDFGSRNELCLILLSKNRKEEAEKERKVLQILIRGWEQSYIEIAIDYANAGFYEDAVSWLLQIEESRYPMVHYYLAYYFANIGKTKEKKAALQKAASLSEERVFPNRLEDIFVLQFAIHENPEDYKASYYLGNLWYDKRQYNEALQWWEKSAYLNDGFATVHRNLGIAYYNKLRDPDKAVSAYKKAFDCNTTDARILFELDHLYGLMNNPVAERLSFLQKHISLVEERDDLYIEYVRLHNLSGNFDEAERLLKKRHFHPWEGGEGKVSAQYVYSKIALAEISLKDKNPGCAIQLLEEAQHYPENLGEGKLYGAQENNIFYLLGCAYDAEGITSKAKSSWQLAAGGTVELSQAIYYNDRNPAMIFYQGLALEKLHREEEAKQHFESLIHYGKDHLNDKIKIDFFAVSLPDLSVFETDPDKQNRIHCHYLMGLGYVGLGERENAETHFQQVLKMNVAHEGVAMYIKQSSERELNIRLKNKTANDK